MASPPYNVFVNYLAALRKPMLVAFGMFPEDQSLAFIWSVAETGSGGSPLPLTGTVDGVNAIFTTPVSVVNGAAIFRNGIALDPATTYTLLGNTVTFNSANIPQPGDDLTCIIFGASGSTSPQGLSGAINGINTTFMTLEPIINGVAIFRNGALQDPAISYSLSLPSTIIFNSANIPQTGDDLIAIVS